MRNDVKPVIRNPDNDPPVGGAHPATPAPGTPPRSGGGGGGGGGADFDREGGSGVRRERGDRVDPAGPKRSQVYGALGDGGAVTDPSGTTGPTSRSNDRASTTTGKLRDRDLERSARQGEAPDIRVLPISTGDSSLSVPVIMAVFALLIAVLAVVVFLSWPTTVDTNADGTIRAGARDLPEDKGRPPVEPTPLENPPPPDATPASSDPAPEPDTGAPPDTSPPPDDAPPQGRA